MDVFGMSEVTPMKLTLLLLMTLWTPLPPPLLPPAPPPLSRRRARLCHHCSLPLAAALPRWPLTLACRR